MEDEAVDPTVVWMSGMAGSPARILEERCSSILMFSTSSRTCTSEDRGPRRESCGTSQKTETTTGWPCRESLPWIAPGTTRSDPEGLNEAQDNQMPTRLPPDRSRPSRSNVRGETVAAAVGPPSVFRHRPSVYDHPFFHHAKTVRLDQGQPDRLLDQSCGDVADHRPIRIRRAGRIPHHHRTP